MIRFIAFLLGKQYEPCKGCEILKHQLELSNHEKEQLVNTILNVVKPNVIPAAPVEYNPLPTKTSWDQRRRFLEAEDRKVAQARAAQEKAIELEKELLGGENAS